MKSSLVPGADSHVACLVRKRRGNRIISALTCWLAISAALPAEAQDSPPQPPQEASQSSAAEPPRRALPAPLDGIFPSSDYLGPTPLIGVPDTDPVWPLTKALWDASPALKNAKIKVYGWLNPGGDASTSKNS